MKIVLIIRSGLLNKKADARLLPGINHLMLDCESGATSEYPLLQGDISPVVIEEILGWLGRLF